MVRSFHGSFFVFQGVGGGGRWLMYEEMSLCSGWVLCGQCRSPFVCCKGMGGGSDG